jgi:hypothetical protein
MKRAPKLLVVVLGLCVATGVTAAAVSCPSGLLQANADEAQSPLPKTRSADDAVGLSLEVSDPPDNTPGAFPNPLRVKQGQKFYVESLDLKARIQATVDEGVSGLAQRGDFKDLDWRGVKRIDQEFGVLPDANGFFTRRRFFGNAKWMQQRSFFIITQLDAQGCPTAAPLVLDAGVDDKRKNGDSFFTRRFRAIQYMTDCVSKDSCIGASKFEEEALVELRYSENDANAFRFRPDTSSLAIRWTARPGPPYNIPVEQVAAPAYAYGFTMDQVVLTPARADGTYAPGTALTVQLTLKDGAGNRLHPPGVLPTYNEFLAGVPSGIQYYRAFFDFSTTFYRRKHKERNFISQIIGPKQNVQPIRTIQELGEFLDNTVDVQEVASLEVDGVFSQIKLWPTSGDLFGGAFIDTSRWNRPVSDTWTYRLPANAPPGTYEISTKARRVYLGEDRFYTSTIQVQVGTSTKTEATLTTGPCSSCHQGDSALKNILHGSDNRAACAGCHAPLAFELEGPIFVRTHFIHSRTNRFDAKLSECKSCHLNLAGIQRTSKAACMSCHQTYPESHVTTFGPVQSMYVGGERESFQPCATGCHLNHPKSGLR